MIIEADAQYVTRRNFPAAGYVVVTWLSATRVHFDSFGASGVTGRGSFLPETFEEIYRPATMADMNAVRYEARPLPETDLWSVWGRVPSPLYPDSRPYECSNGANAREMNDHR